jgi:hypothetical protein
MCKSTLLLSVVLTFARSAYGNDFTCGAARQQFQGGGCCGAEDTKVLKTGITDAEVVQVLEDWAEVVVTLGAMWRDNGQSCTNSSTGQEDIREFATLQLPRLYNFEHLLFKPTFTYGNETFRDDLNSTLSYFIGACSGTQIQGDEGFALGGVNGRDAMQWLGWTRVEWDTRVAAFPTRGVRFAVGKATFTPHQASLDSSTVDKTFGFYRTRGEGGTVKIIQHHSSTAFSE